MQRRPDVYQEFVVQELREDHRRIRDALLAVKDALQNNCPARARTVVDALTVVAGPYLRFQEEFLYPALSRHADDGVEKLAAGHEQAVVALGSVAALTRRPDPKDEDVQAGLRDVMTVLAHVLGTGALAVCLADLSLEELDRLGHGIAACRADGGE